RAAHGGRGAERGRCARRRRHVALRRIGRDGPARPRAPACDADITVVGAAASGHAAIGARLASWDAELPAPGDWTRRAEPAVARRAADTLAADESGTGDAVRRTVFGATADDIHRPDAGAAA